MAFEGLSEKLNSVFKGLRGKGRLTEEDIKLAMREVRMALLEADVSYKVVKDFVARVSERAVGAEVLDSLTPAQQVIKIVNEELTALMGGANAQLDLGQQPADGRDDGRPSGRGQNDERAPSSPAFCAEQGKRPLLAACDVYRPAAIDAAAGRRRTARPARVRDGADRPRAASQVEAVKYAKRPRQRHRLSRYRRPPAHRRAAHGRAQARQGGGEAERRSCWSWTP